MFKRKSVLYRYLASFVSIAMICSVVIGIVSYFVAAKELRESAVNEQAKRLTVAAEDISAQFEHLEEISHRAMTSAFLSPSYFSRNAYYEVELLSELEKYSSYSSLFTYYFLHYEGDNSLFTNTGKAMPLPYLVSKMSPEEAQQTLQLLDSRSICFLPIASGTLAVYPINFKSTQKYSGNATISFFIPSNNLLSRAQLISGEDFSRMEIRWNDASACTIGNILSPLTIKYADVTLILDQEEVGVGTSEHFLHLSLTLLLIFASMLCLLAIGVAIYNFKPIANLARRHNMKKGGNELVHLDRTLSDMKNELQLSQEQLQEHMTQFRKLRDDLQRHFIAQIVRGETDEQSIDRMREAGMHLPGETFYAFVLHPALNYDYPMLEKAITELSNDHTAFYICPYNSENTYAIIVNTDNGDDLLNILREACPDAEIYGGGNTDLLKEIPALLFYGVTEADPLNVQPSDIARYNEDEYLHKFRKALEDGDEMLAISCLNEYRAAYANYNDAIQKMISNNIIATLLSFSYEAKLNVPHDFLSSMNEDPSLMNGWISAICSRNENTLDGLAPQVIGYIQKHFLDFDLSLQSVADSFQRSTRQISRIVRAETGKGYKEFVTQLRMEHAKALLRSGQRVSDVCEAIGYSSRSHFIQTFTQYTGMTPASYRSNESKGSPEKCEDEEATG